MYRLLLIVVPILTILALAFVAIFTPFGSNATLKPLANNYLKSKITKPKLEITKLDSKPGFIDVDIKSDNSIVANAKGNVSYFSKKFNLDYKANAQTVTVNNRDVKIDLNISGKAVGVAKNFNVTGKGRAFNSDIDYKFLLKNSEPKAIKADINRARISKIFALLNKQALLDGYLFVNANMPSLDIKNPSGNATIEVKNGVLSNALIKKLYKIDLPKDERLKAKIIASVAKKYIISKGRIDTTTAKIDINKLTSTLDFQKSKGYYNLFIPELSRLNSITKLNLKGSLNSSGIFFIDRKKETLQLQSTTKDFGGETKINYLSNRLSAKLSDVNPIKILRKLSQPSYISAGSINGYLKLNDIKNLSGNFAINTSGTLNKKLLKVQMPSYSYKLKAKGQLKDNTIYVKQANLLTNFVNLNLHNLSYATLLSALKSDFNANIENLRALQIFTKTALNGKVNLTGHIDKLGDKVSLNAKTKSLGGTTNIKYNNNSANIDFQDIELAKVLYILNQPHFIENSKASGKIKLSNIEKLNGLFTIKSVGSIDTKTLQKLYNINLGDSFKYSMLVRDGVVKDGRFITQPKANTSFGSIDFDYLNYDKNIDKLTGKYLVKIPDLAKLEPLIGKKLNGAFNFKGTIKRVKNQLIVTAVANELSGVINLISDNNKIKVDAAGVSAVKALRLLNLEEVIDGVAEFNLNYFKAKRSGNFSLKLDEARFLNSSLVDNLKNYANFDLSKEVFENANIDGKIDNSIITFNLDTHSQRVAISSKNAKIDTKNMTIDARVTINHKNQDYTFRVSGDIKNPRIKLIFNGYVKRKVMKKVKEKLEDLGVDKEIDKIIPNEIKALKDDNKTKEKIKKIVPNEIKGLFKGIF